PPSIFASALPFATKTHFVTRCPSMFFPALTRNFSTFPSPKMNPSKMKIPLYLRASGGNHPKSDLRQIKPIARKKFRSFFSGTLIGNHWKIGQKP
ncbi:MAG TPA: hypothetical protein VMD57_05160, partial [Candidatus Baltobacteraceae bacterium]|nr:hypothetical protein [Candidatus Baltobacteraceae bacterium]